MLDFLNWYEFEASTRRKLVRHHLLSYLCGMNCIKLRPYYRLYAFSDYGSMKLALPYMQRVVLAKALAEVEESEIRGYVERISGQGYKNYLGYMGLEPAQRSALKSFITALQMLYKSNGYSARYVVVERV